MAKSRSIKAHEFFFFDLAQLLFEMLVYLITFIAPAYAIWHLRTDHPFLLLAATLASLPVAALTHVLVLVCARRVILRRVPKGRMFRTDPTALRWLLAGLLQGILWRGPFWGWINGNFIFRQLYYRGMGAQIDGTLLTGGEVKICEPWSFKAGRNVFIADGAIIAGHKIEREVVALGPVEIGNNVLIGGRVIIFPDVKIGDGAVVGAQSVVRRGTVIPAGETWAGNPAVRVDLFQGSMTTVTSSSTRQPVQEIKQGKPLIFEEQMQSGALQRLSISSGEAIPKMVGVQNANR